jgi:hypothetical protein
MATKVPRGLRINIPITGEIYEQVQMDADEHCRSNGSQILFILRDWYARRKQLQSVDSAGAI